MINNYDFPIGFEILDASIMNGSIQFYNQLDSNGNYINQASFAVFAQKVLNLVPFVIKDLNNNLIINNEFLAISVNGADSTGILAAFGSQPLYDELTEYYKNSFTEYYDTNQERYTYDAKINIDFKAVFNDGTECIILKGEPDPNRPVISFTARRSMIRGGIYSETPFTPDLTKNYKYRFNWYTSDSSKIIPVQVPAYTTTFSSSPYNIDAPVVVDVSNYGIFLENIAAPELIALTNRNFPDATVLNVTLTKNNQSFTFTNLKLNFISNRNFPIDLYEENTPKSFNYAYFSTEDYAPYGIMVSTSSTDENDIESFILDNNISRHPWGHIDDPDLTITISVAQQTVYPVGIDSLTTTNTFTIKNIIANSLFGNTNIINTELTANSAMISEFNTLQAQMFSNPYFLQGPYVGAVLAEVLSNIVIVGSTVVGAITVDPTTTPILVNNQPLPVNSVLKNASTGQKYIKVEGGATAFVAIEVIPPTEWGWSQEGIDAWAVLQNL